MSKGLFISFEGSDGSGKSTALESVASYYSSKGEKVFTTFEPGDTLLGKYIRELTLFQKENSINLDQKTLLLLMLADRVHHIETVIKPKLKEGYIVLCDRFTDSTIVYQAYAGGLDLQMVAKVVNSTIDLVPDLTLLFDVTLDTVKQRKRLDVGSLDSIESKGKVYFEKVLEGYKLLAKNNSNRIVTVDANKNVQEVKNQVLKILNFKLPFLRGQRVDDKEGKIKPLTDDLGNNANNVKLPDNFNKYFKSN